MASRDAFFRFNYVDNYTLLPQDNFPVTKLKLPRIR